MSGKPVHPAKILKNDIIAHKKKYQAKNRQITLGQVANVLKSNNKYNNSTLVHKNHRSDNTTWLGTPTYNRLPKSEIDCLLKEQKEEKAILLERIESFRGTKDEKGSFRKLLSVVVNEKEYNKLEGGRSIGSVEKKREEVSYKVERYWAGTTTAEEQGGTVATGPNALPCDDRTRAPSPFRTESKGGSSVTSKRGRGTFRANCSHVQEDNRERRVGVGGGEREAAGGRSCEEEEDAAEATEKIPY